MFPLELRKSLLQERVLQVILVMLGILGTLETPGLGEQGVVVEERLVEDSLDLVVMVEVLGQIIQYQRVA